MSYRKYNTPAFVLASGDYDEADRFFVLYTKELGLVKASAKSVRVMKSKLRYALQDYSYIEVSLVRGKTVWRITGAEPKRNLFSELQETPKKLAVFLNVISLLRRLVHGEQRDRKLFEMLKEGFEFLIENELDAEALSNCEILLVLRMLNRLGYLKAHRNLTAFLREKDWDTETVQSVDEVRGDALEEVNRSLNAIQL